MEQLKERIGPFPVWIWLALITAVGLAWFLWEQHKNGSSSATTPATPEGAAQVPETVNQTTISLTPPAAPNPAAPAAPAAPSVIKAMDGGQFRVIGYGDLNVLAKALGVTEQQLIKDNPGLRKLYGSGKPVPVGTVLKTTAPTKATHPVTPAPGKGSGPVRRPGGKIAA